MRIAINTVRAKKLHECDMCHETIHPEEHYSIGSYQDNNGYHQNVKACGKHSWAELRAFIEMKV